MNKYDHLQKISQLIRYYSLISTTEAGSGHVTSSLSAADLMSVLMFGGFFKFDIDHPDNPVNDRLIFSKGHASPLFYALWTVAGVLTEQDLLTLRKFGSPLEGHPTSHFKYTEAATGSLGQGLSVGVGYALNAKYVDKVPYSTYVLLGDSEMAEGSVWEAVQIASYYKLDNLVAVIDVNRLGQRGETIYGHDMKAYEKRLSSFGWHTSIIDGHSYEHINKAYRDVATVKGKPKVIIAKTIKGKGISFLEDKDGWHGIAVPKEQLQSALKDLGEIDKSITKHLVKPKVSITLSKKLKPKKTIKLDLSKPMATRKIYGKTLASIFPKYSNIVVLDAEVSNSTYSQDFQEIYPERFFEMFIAEQNMVGVALGFARRGKIPFVSSFAAFLTRAFDQIRMAQYSDANIKFVGSHAGVSVGEDGPSQMGLEDIALFRSILDCKVLYPSDIVATVKLVEQAAANYGMFYLRTTRPTAAVLYPQSEMFPIGGSKTLKTSKNDQVTLIAAGITVHEALKAYDELVQEDIHVRVIDLYSIKPLDQEVLEKAASETKALITIEDHYPAGGIGEAVTSALSRTNIPIYLLTVTKLPRSGTAEELLDFEGISSQGIIKKVKEII
ncbi:transketolase [Candidatus Roizmanbacteria bacterium RIFCSPLOWO2_02_FULL_37_19]|uniref:Transketolase n=1 Tax=Candidatus Roizmanbacteria bacterium RIFCSPHIGHO2_02_FULL_37_24 TaxID=1802037 RepID=A0A1F7GZN2_9BACT|nr:MAG: transketolase [Candidatus Roizmanbacteria bacterium RIFCSPHIGHO2_01_FULL_38_41]OGK24529.1 MAG: transketolase [Candidatus Roizmanbacteria bacterium RIFCSPHIGHO2_02_FULL_37_24]OGK31983.1 MAG: transketolase [Candidatus Roizmanbacteria bacterium RIFCSPHIGHO2_12_FULL_37_23]OGK43784.1 MAG: transketolase [Candidatus Roizmanbacteria bacterium RIFCSPLOWO2_01_FULL_37_57]OGK54338.1 MAG: transketolase [Candidatus Roizmanbacteria bacterium RIFCSPLOWO2_02_FULL_37_19]OGK59718.1 MAG: transketolase [Ca